MLMLHGQKLGPRSAPNRPLMEQYSKASFRLSVDKYQYLKTQVTKASKKPYTDFCIANWSAPTQTSAIPPRLYLVHAWPSWWDRLAHDRPVWWGCWADGPCWVATHGCGNSPGLAGPPSAGPPGWKHFGTAWQPVAHISRKLIYTKFCIVLPGNFWVVLGKLSALSIGLWFS